MMFGGSAMISGLLVLLLPDTINTKLPDTIEEAEDLGHQGQHDKPSHEEDCC